jgi:hypothetical protein
MTIQCLGIPFGVEVSLVDEWTWIMGKFEKKLLAWSLLDLSLVGLITIVDKLLAS